MNGEYFCLLGLLTSHTLANIFKLIKMLSLRVSKGIFSLKIFFLLGFTPYKAKQPLVGIELQKKKKRGKFKFK